MAYSLNSQLVRDALTKAAQELPPLPSVMVRVLQLTENSNSGTVNEIEALLKSDQAISSKLLRVVNSPYFGLSGQVASVSQAVVILGFQQVRNLVLSVSMMSQFSGSSESTKDAQVQLWETAFGTASAAQLIARKKRFSSADNELCFIGGLLQNIGSLFMLNAITRQYQSVLEESLNSGKRLSEVETTRLGITHAEVGQQLLVKWKLPDNIVFLVNGHEGPYGDEPSSALYAVHAGECLAQSLSSNEPISFETLGIDPKVQEWLGLSIDDLQEICDTTREKVSAALDLIG